MGYKEGSWSKSSERERVVGYSPDSNEVSAEVEESPVLEGHSRLKRFNMCCNDM
jgi:hypothetical protein